MCWKYLEDLLNIIQVNITSLIIMADGNTMYSVSADGNTTYSVSVLPSTFRDFSLAHDSRVELKFEQKYD